MIFFDNLKKTKQKQKLNVSCKITFMNSRYLFLLNNYINIKKENYMTSFIILRAFVEVDLSG